MEKEKVKTLEHAIEAMRKKIEAEAPVFLDEPLSQEVRTTTGELVLRTNPNVSEFRALVKDYANAIKSYKDIAGDMANDNVDQLANLRERFKVI